MTQLIVDGISMPEATRDRYACGEEDLSVQLDMISGRRVVEARKKVWKISYTYDYLGNTLLRQIMAVLRSGTPFQVAFLPDNSNEMLSSMFLTESVTNPTWAFSRNSVGLWHNLIFTLREERPHA